MNEIITPLKWCRSKQLDEFGLLSEDDLDSIEGEAVLGKDEEISTKETVFVIDNDPDTALSLKNRIVEERGDALNVIRMSSMRELRKYLKRDKPDIVVTGTVLYEEGDEKAGMQGDASAYADAKEEEKDRLEAIMDMVLEKNTDARFIITAPDAEIRSPLTGQRDDARRDIEEIT